LPTPPLADELAFAAVEAVREHGSVTAAALAIGVPRQTFDGRYKIGLQRQAKAGVEAPYVVKGTSTYFDSDGNARAQWVKTSIDERRRAEMMRAAADAMAETLPRVSPIAAPSVTDPDLLNLYVLTDAHIGMLAWHREGGEDWDLAIAERVITGCFRQMIRGAPKAQTAIIGQLGDLLHYDGLLPVTPTSGHVLDADSRFAKMVEVAVRVLRRVVTMALEKHQKVILLPAEGNHDLASSVWLRTMFSALYEAEPRVEVDTTAKPFYAHQHGEVMLCFHHGHMAKNDNLPSIFAAEYASMWGLTTKRYAHCGDKHHAERKEHRGMEVEQHPTLAARDAYASRHGYHAMRRTNAITYHASFGEVGRVTVSPEMVAAA